MQARVAQVSKPLHKVILALRQLISRTLIVQLDIIAVIIRAQGNGLFSNSNVYNSVVGVPVPVLVMKMRRWRMRSNSEHELLVTDLPAPACRLHITT